MDSYRYLAKVYDVMMYDVDYNKWAEYIDVILKRRGAETLFEVSCGTGGVTFFLESLGYDVIASDSSAEMLDVAKRKGAELCSEVKFVHQDMRHIEAARKFDAVLSVCDGANYLGSDGLYKFLKSAYDALKTGGALLFDISSGYKLRGMNGESYFDEADDAVCIWKNTYDEDLNALLMDVTIFIKQNELYKKYIETHTQYEHSADEVRYAAAEAGFSNIEVYDCFTFDPPKSDSKRLQFICIKN